MIITAEQQIRERERWEEMEWEVRRKKVQHVRGCLDKSAEDAAMLKAFFKMTETPNSTSVYMISFQSLKPYVYYK